MDEIEKISIKKIPYLSISFKLFDEFLLFGYSLSEQKRIIELNEGRIAETDKSTFPFLNKEDKSNVIHQSTFPSVLSSISNPDKPQLLKAEAIRGFFFPNPPVILSKPKLSQSEADLPEYNAIYFLNCDTNETKTKSLFYGFANIFYEESKLKDFRPGHTYYFPKAICFISQYPFFSHYLDLAKTTRSLFSNLNTPVELILYNIINHCLPPLYNNLNIEFIPELFKEDIANASREFDRLSGYPIIDIDYSVLFSLLSIENIIQIFLFSFIEKQMLFFSENIEVLNCVLYLFHTMHYPCTDAMYLWHLLSISETDLLNKDLTCSFVGKPFSSMMGVNCTFKKTIDTDSFSMKELFMVDLDNKNFYAKLDPTTSLSALYNYLTDLLNKPINPTNSFEENLKLLFIKLKKYAPKETKDDKDNSKRAKADFFLNKDFKQTNIEIQEVFYSFVLNIIKPLYSFVSLIKDLDELKKKQDDIHNIIDNNKRINKENKFELIFYQELSDTTKFSNYLLNFLNHGDTFECYLISCNFSEEFLQMNNTIAEEYTIPHFEIIDLFFWSDKTVKLSLCNYTKVVQSGGLNYISKHLIQRLSPDVSLKSSLIYLYHSVLSNIEEDCRNIFPALANTLEYKDMVYSDLSQHIEEIMITKNLMGGTYATSFGTTVLFLITSELLPKENFQQIFRVAIELLINEVSFVGANVKPRFLRKNISMFMKVLCYSIHKANKLKVEIQFLLSIYHQLLDVLVLLENHPNIDLMTSIRGINEKDNSTISKYQVVLEEQFIQQIQKKKDMEHKANFEQVKHTKDESYLIMLSSNKCRDGLVKDEMFLQKMKSTVESCNLSYTCPKCQKELHPEVTLKVRKHADSKAKLFSPLKMYTLTRSLLSQWEKNKMTFSALDKTAVKALMLNLMFYQSKMDLSNSVPIIEELL